MIIAYHRIRNEPKSITPKQFEKQVVLAKQLGAKLTFDDGLKEHFTTAFPILKKYKMKGTFFYITNCQNKMATTHKLWLLLRDYEKDLVKDLKIPNKKLPILNPGYYINDTIQLRNLKYYFYTHHRQVDAFFKDYYNEDKEIGKMYMDVDKLLRLYDAKMEIGSHSCTHPILTTLSKNEQEQEIKDSSKFLSLIERPIGFSYPHGQYNETTIQLLKKYKYKYAVSTEADNIYALRRIDANVFG